MQSVQVPSVCLYVITKTPCARFGAVLLVLLLAGTMGCQEIATKLGRAELPNLGPPIPVSVRMQFDPSLTDAKANYVDSCNHPREVKIGEPLEDVLLQAAQQNFKTVYAGRGPAEAKPDVEVRIALLQPRLNIKTDNVYDREPADLTLDAVATFRDSSGKLLLEQPIQASRQERLLVEPTQQRCAYASIDKFVHDTAVSLSIKFVREARALLDPDNQAAAGQAPSSQSGQPSAQGPATLSFKATILDENNNLILESGERVKVRVDLANSGGGPAQGVSVNLTGTPLLVSQFPSTTLTVGTLQPGESRSVEFSATLPQAVPAQRGELVVTITEASGRGAPAAQTLVAAMRPEGEVGAGGRSAAARYDDVDRVPAASPGFQRPKTHLLTVGISSYRDQDIPARKYATLDAEMVAAYFQSLGGVPAANVRLLQDQKALRPDIEEVLLDWLPPRVTAESVVIVYFAGQAVVAPSGETYLVPYEGRWNSASRLYPIKDLQAALARLKTRVTLFIFDGSVSTLGGDTRSRSKAPQWDVGGGGVVRLIGTTGLRNGLESEKLRHGLFTYYLLRGLKGEADTNRDGEVTLGELTAFLGQAVPAAARNNFRQEQRPLILPPIDPASKLASLTLTRPAAVAGSDGR